MVEKLMNDILRTNSIKKIENIKQPLYMQSQSWGLRLFKIIFKRKTIIPKYFVSVANFIFITVFLEFNFKISKYKIEIILYFYEENAVFFFFGEFSSLLSDIYILCYGFIKSIVYLSVKKYPSKIIFFLNPKILFEFSLIFQLVLVFL